MESFENGPKYGLLWKWPSLKVWVHHTKAMKTEGHNAPLGTMIGFIKCRTKNHLGGFFLTTILCLACKATVIYFTREERHSCSTQIMSTSLAHYKQTFYWSSKESRSIHVGVRLHGSSPDPVVERVSCSCLLSTGLISDLLTISTKEAKYLSLYN